MTRVSDDEINALIEQIASIDLHLAHQCLLEIPPGQVRRMPAFQTVTGKLVQRITAPDQNDLGSKIAAAATLGVLDPRISLDNPLQGVVEVPGSEHLPAFRLGKYPVTNMEFAQFVEAGGYTEQHKQYWGTSWKWLEDNRLPHPQHWHDEHLNQPNYPVVGVCLYEAVAYCKWLSEKYKDLGYTFRLPTDIEWDRAAHGNAFVAQRHLLHRWLLQIVVTALQRALEDRKTETRLSPSLHPHAAETDAIQALLPELTDHMAQFQCQIRSDTLTPVGVFTSNKDLQGNERGCFDLFGQVWEWTDSWLYLVNHQPSDTEKQLDWPVVVKGGPGKASHLVWAVIGSRLDPYQRAPDVGFRICCTPTATATAPRQSRPVEVEPLFWQALALVEEGQKLRESQELHTHAERATMADQLNQLALRATDQGHYAEGLKLGKQALEIRQEVYGAKHLDVAMSLNNVANIHRALGDYTQSEELQKQAIEIKQEVVGSEDISTARSYTLLALLYYEQGRYASPELYAKAKEYYQRALKIKEKWWGPWGTNLAITLNGLADVYRAQKQCATARRLYKRAQKIWEKAGWPEHAEVAWSLNGLAGLERIRGADKEAETLYEQALEMRKKTLGAEHPDVAESLQDLAELYCAQGKYDEAERHFQAALAIRRQRLGAAHPKVAHTLAAYAACLRQNNREAEAETRVAEAEAIRTRHAQENRRSAQEEAPTA